MSLVVALRGRVKPVESGRGFGVKRPPTPQELDWLERAWGEGCLTRGRGS
jgi:hypothetical protein